jgi:ribose transport system substrate-binding protein
VTISPSLGSPEGLEKAAELLDWRVTVFDGKFTPDLLVNGNRQAIADGADGIVIGFADCATIKAGLQDADDAGIPVINLESSDCDVEITDEGAIEETGQPGLFDSEVGYHNPEDPEDPLSFIEVWNVFTSYQALGIAEGTDGAGKVIVLSETDIRVNFSGLRSFKETLEEQCPDCEIVETIEFTGGDLGVKLQDKVAQALVQHPDANAVYGMYDAPTQDVSTAVLSSGRKDDIFVMGGEGTAPVVELIDKERGVNAGVGFSVDWESWAAIDALNRLLQGEVPANGVAFPTGVGVQLFTKIRNFPEGGGTFKPAVDYEAAYSKAWGVD